MSTLSHSFLLQPGQWTITGHSIDKVGHPTQFSGIWMIQWLQDDWFQMTTQLYPEPDQDTQLFALNYKGYLGEADQQYSYVSHHTQWGQLEGQGRITPATITHNFWGVGDHRSGLEVFYKLSEDCYTLSSGLMVKNKLLSTIEAVLKRAA